MQVPPVRSVSIHFLSAAASLQVMTGERICLCAALMLAKQCKCQTLSVEHDSKDNGGLISENND